MLSPDAEGGGEGHPLDLAGVAVGQRQARVDEIHELASLYDGARPHHEALLAALLAAALGPAGAHRLPPRDELEEDHAERVHVELVAHLAVHEVLRSQVSATKQDR